MATSVSILGSTGSIGTQTLDVIAANPDRFELAAIGAHSSTKLLIEQAHQFRPRLVAVADDAHAHEVRDSLPIGVEFVAGPRAFADLATEADVCVNGVVGFAGLPVTLAALAGGRRLALANKESLITAGPIVAQVRHTPGAEILPVDSEHAAVHMCLAGHRAAHAAGLPNRVRRLVLTHVLPWADPQAVLAEAREAYAGPVELAACGASYDV